MSRFKKMLSLLLAVVMTAGIAISGTLAYLTSEDSDVNVMTLGNVKIEQREYQRAKKVPHTGLAQNGDLVEFKQGQPLYPAVPADKTAYTAEATELFYWGPYVTAESDGTKNGAGNGLWDERKLANVMDKMIFVENTGKSDCYYRTIIAFECPDGMEYSADSDKEFMMNVNGNNRFTWDYLDEYVVINGTRYLIANATYNNVLQAGKISRPSLLQVVMTEHATSEDMELLGGSYEILAVSQAVQTAGFENAAAALNAGFGEVNEDHVIEWFGELYIPDYTLPIVEPENGNVAVPKNKTLVLTGEYSEPITVSGEGTLYLRDLTIKPDQTSAIMTLDNTAAAVNPSALSLTDGATVKLVVENDVALTGAVGGNGIYVPANTTLDLSGVGSLIAIGNAGVDDTAGGSGIGGEGTINIHDLSELTAEGWGKHGFGIGGATSNITIENTNIPYVKGGYVQPEFINDTSYGKSEPEGGAAIGSSVDGAVITLTNVAIDEAEGGSKCAGIGARFWTGVAINIDECDIKNVEGGNASAGIGGSRVDDDSNQISNDAVTIHISDSSITAKGGQFAAGIGSGYDTHCSESQPTHTINITGNSVINATGGKYGAGIGTGYHVASLAGKIEDTVTVHATAGESREKYTYAMDVGFGVIDKTREGKGNISSFDNKGVIINIDSAPDVQ